MKFLAYFYRWASSLFLGLALTQMAYAVPDDDPVGQLIQQKQAEVQKAARAKASREAAPRNNNDDDEIGRIARQNASRATVAAKPAATPNRPREESTATEKNSRGDVDDLISSAMGFLGVAYRFGGTSPTGFDCSGFMQYIFRKAFAVNLPRTSAEQASVGVAVSRSQLQAGDMVFFRTSGSRISHVGMYIGNDRFIHAPRTGRKIEITSLSSQYWSSRYATARRVKRNNAQNFIRN